MNWRKKTKKWLSVKSFTGRAITDVDEETVAPVLLREINSAGSTLLAVAPTLAEADRIHAELQCWCREFEISLKILYLPETIDGNVFMPANEADRARALYQTLKAEHDLIIGSISSFLTPVPAPEQLLDSELALTSGMHIPFGKLLEKLVALDYDDEFEVTVKCEFSRRGGLIDVFSPAHDFPVRIEFWGDQIDSLRRFSPESQRSCGDVQEYRIIARGGMNEQNSGLDFFNFTTGISDGLAVIFPEQCFEHLEKYGTGVEPARMRQVIADFEQRNKLLRICDPVEKTDVANAKKVQCFPAAGHLKKSLPEELRGEGMEMLRQIIAGQIRQWLDSDYEVVLLGLDKDACGHIKNWCKNYEIKSGNLTIDVANLPSGVIFPVEKIVCLTESEIFTANIFKKKSFLTPKEERNVVAEEAAACADLDEGDYAVHLVHGIGIFRGIKEIESRGVKREVMVLEYRDHAMVYVPLSQAGMVSRYIGSQGTASIHKLGGKKWMAEKAGTALAVKDFAAELLRFQAVRNASKGIAFPPDCLEQRVFDDAFPFEDTPDQVRAIMEIKQDMISARPMDRLLCGDVGYGKTEVSIRMAFKAVAAGYQVVVLVPTTVLAQQHYYTFSERFAQYPYVIEMLSRFRTKQEQADILKKLQSGGIDIIIGTHRLFQDDIKFSRLGLVIVDEEQRFGVKHKEKIKSFRAQVDVLTMSATPIPRTLYMAMAGARDLSTIMTAPCLRLPIKTIVAQQDEKFIVEAVRTEVARGGQVFYIHNRVGSINEYTEKLMGLMPDIKFGVAHGQMDEDELELSMAEFLSGNIDVLVCTTIIESGLDIPNANTIIIERADRFGLAELYQLRGRVGRWNRQAYAYLLLPKDNIITSDARKRISAIRRYTHLGAGFRLALRDLEIRGAGNLLGAEQSGYVNNVGFDLYCQLLKFEINRMQGMTTEFMPNVDVTIDFIHFAHEAPENAVAAGFPPEYIPCERLRVDAYRRLALLTSEEQLNALRDELEDRYGNLPESAENMLKITLIKIFAAASGYNSVSVNEGKVIFKNNYGTYRRNGIIPVINIKNPPKVRLENLLDIARLLQPPQKTDKI